VLNVAHSDLLIFKMLLEFKLVTECYIESQQTNVN